MSSKTFTISDSLHQYLLDASLRDHPVLAGLRHHTLANPLAASMARMQISPEQGQFMALLVKLMGAKRCLEIGVFTGYSSLCVAMALPEDGRIIACDVSEDWTRIGREHWTKAGVAHKIDLRIAPALGTLDGLIADGQAGSFDFCFIDADKTNYRGYYERALQLLRVGGLIAIDNTLWSGKVADPGNTEPDTVALRELNAFLKTDLRVELSLLPIGDGLTLALKK